MAERTQKQNTRANIPHSAACGQWETLLADALDGRLEPADESTFTAHMAGCAACTTLFSEASRGREWLKFLFPEPEVPEGLLDRILAQTGPGHKPAQPALAGAGILPIPAWQRPGLMGQVRRWAEPRLMMTAAMAFFSIALTLNLTGVRITQFRLADLRPTAIRSFMERRLTMASVPIVRYYDHLRFVYEVQSRMRELRNQNQETRPQPSTPTTPGESRQNRKNGGSRAHPLFDSPQPSGPQQQSVQPVPVNPDFVETSLRPNPKTRPESSPKASAFRRLRTISKASERSNVWTA